MKNRNGSKQPTSSQLPTASGLQTAVYSSSTPTVDGMDTGRPRNFPGKEVDTTYTPMTEADVTKIMEKMLEEERLASKENELYRRRSPFTREILEKPAPSKFKMPQIPSYSGKEDPREHIDYYETLTSLYGWEDAIMCRAFSLTLTGCARAWFSSLSEGSISSFDLLRKRFINAFIFDIKKRDSTYLFTIKQGSQESLRQFLRRFRDAIFEIGGLPVELAVTALFQGTRDEQFLRSIAGDSPTSLSDLFDLANKVISVEEVVDTVMGQERRECGKRKERW